MTSPKFPATDGRPGPEDGVSAGRFLTALFILLIVPLAVLWIYQWVHVDVPGLKLADRIHAGKEEKLSYADVDSSFGFSSARTDSIRIYVRPTLHHESPDGGHYFRIKIQRRK